MDVIKPGNIVKCEDYSGIWYVTQITESKAFKNNYYACITKVLNEDFTIPDNEITYVCITTLCNKLPVQTLFDNVIILQEKMSNLIKLINSNVNN